ncbi:MAG TPA: Ig domain-containing protein, partial [bacterium]|nr:Ig domain-containing protein [bacterium]
QTICFTVRVTDSCPCEPQTAERQFCIIVKPNQCPPGPSFVTTELPDANFGEAYDATIEITGGVAPFTFAIIAGTLPAGLSLDPDTGEITGTPTNPNQQCQDFTIRVRVTDSCPFPPRSITRDFTFTVNPEACEPLSIGNTEFPNARLNVAYNATLIAVGGEGPFTWELVSGSLPTGLTVNADGTISGTPTNEDEVGDSFTFTVEVTDSCECEPQTARATFTIELEPEQPGEGCPSDVQFTSPQHLPDACFGEPYFFQLETEGGFGDEDFELTTPPLPSGLTLDEETGIISGTPNDPDEIGDMIMFDVTVTDVCPSDDTEWFVINVVQCGGEG